MCALCLASGLWAADSPRFETLLRQGLLALESNDISVARTQLEEASRLHPSGARAWLGLAQAYWKSNEESRADEAAAKAHSLAPDDAVVLHGLAIFYSQAGRWGEAAEMESRFADSDLGDSDAFLRAASFYLQANLPKKSAATAKRGLAKENRADLQFGRAWHKGNFLASKE